LRFNEAIMTTKSRRLKLSAFVLAALLLGIGLSMPGRSGAEGSGSLYPSTSAGLFRANLEWRTTFYGAGDSPGFNILRRTLLKVYVEQGEHIIVGSSGVGVNGAPNNGDIRIFNPGAITGPIGNETVPALSGPAVPAQPGASANGFSCVAQRAVGGNADRGRIGSRTAELAGPNTENNLNPTGYRPCIYTAPVAGIYDVIFTGPSGANSNIEPDNSGAVNPIAADFGPLQYTSVTAWDVSVRKDVNALPTESGRAFTYYFAGNTGDGGRDVIGVGVTVTDFGFVYRIRYAGDPFGFIVFANQLGYQDSDGSPLYHAVMADPGAAPQDQNELKEIQGGVQILPPKYPIFLSEPYPPALDALGIPREPIVPAIADLVFSGSQSGNVSRVGDGGTFSLQTSQSGVYTIVISRDGVDFNPLNPRNRLLRGLASTPGPITVSWNGLANNGEIFPVGTYTVRSRVQGGEVHFPFLDVENNITGGPEVQLLNPPDINGDGVGDCPPRNGGCFGAFYDDSGYITANGTLVGTAVGGPLCAGGVGNPPRELFTDPLLGYDTRTDQRAYGFPYDANPPQICSAAGGYGDKKALDLWTFYPSNQLETPLRIIDATAVSLSSFTATAGDSGVTLRWSTGSELDTAGFHLLRSASGNRADAARVTPTLIPARGGSSEWASYSWLDAKAAQGQRYSYWLEEHELNGSTNEYGPAVVAPATSAGPQTVWLPLLRR
jgi:hypothetical protein